MTNFKEIFNDLITQLISNIFSEHLENNPTYIKLDAENELQFRQLQKYVPSTLLSNYIETLFELESFETNYYYLCGMRDKNKPDDVRPTSEEFFQELIKYDVYKQLHDKTTLLFSELTAVLSSEYRSILIQYIETRNAITDLEKHFSYAGGMHDKAVLEEQLDFTKKITWEGFIGLCS